MVELHSCNASIKLITWRHTISTIWNNKHQSQSHSRGTRNPVNLWSATEDWCPASRRSSCLMPGDPERLPFTSKTWHQKQTLRRAEGFLPQQMLLKPKGGWLTGHHDSHWKTRGRHQHHPQDLQGRSLSPSWSVLHSQECLPGSGSVYYRSASQVWTPGAQIAILAPVQTRLCPSLEILRDGF